MTIAREKTNRAAHPYVYMAVLALGLATVYLALKGTEQPESVAPDRREAGVD